MKRKRQNRGLWNLFLRLGLQKKIIYSMLLLFAVIILCYMVFFASVLIENDKKYVQESLQGTCDRVDTELQHYFDQVDRTANMVCFNRTLQKVLRGKDRYTTLDYYEMLDNVSEFLNNIADTSQIWRLYLVDLEGTVLNTDGDNDFLLDMEPLLEPFNETWIQQLQADGRMMEELEFRYAHMKTTYWGINLYYPVRDYNSVLSIIGYLVVCIPNTTLDFVMDGLGEELDVQLLGSKGQVIAQTSGSILPEFEEGFPTETVVAQQDSLLYAAPIPDYGWELRVRADRFDGALSGLGIMGALPLSVVLFILLVAGIGFLLSRYLVRPIIDCKDALLRIEQNEIGLQIENPYQDEIGELLGGFNQMSAALDHLIEQNKEMNALRLDMELKMLQQQINPHFLYNTLDLINGLILAGQEEEAVHVCEMLGRMFRYNLKNARQVPLREEYSYVQSYLYIARLKQPRLVVMEEVEESLLDCMIPKMILQPLVENAIRHGFAKTMEESCITLGIAQEGNRLLLSVMDNGVGIPEAQLQQLRERMAQIRADRSLPENPHIGLENIYHRLLLEYRGDVRMELISKEGKGTRVELHLPRVKEDRNV